MRYLLWLYLLCQPLLALARSDPFPEVAASYLLEVNGQTLWHRQSQRRLAPASLTKLMAALLVAERNEPQAIATVGRAAAHETGTRLGLRAGEQFQQQDLLAAALIASANDACHALADALAGNEMRFVALMNRRALELGLRNTHFVNACGHDAPGHYASAQDLALLAREVIKHSLITELTLKAQARIATVSGARSYEFKNTNALIGRYPGALGLKTGVTPAAGKCLVAWAQRGGSQILLVMLHGSNRWWDAADMLDLAFDHASNPH